MKEYIFEDGDTVYELLGKKSVEYIRADYKNHCFGVAKCLYNVLLKVGIMSAFITFKTESPFVNSLKVWDKEYMHHSVLFLGDCILDLLHSDMLIPIKDYVDMLNENNKDWVVVQDMSSCWYNESDIPFAITKSFLESF